MQWVTTKSFGDWLFASHDEMVAKGWHRKFAWLPTDINAFDYLPPDLETDWETWKRPPKKPNHWVWLRFYWRRYRYQIGGWEYPTDVYDRRLTPPDNG